MITLNKIGLDIQKSEKLSELLSDLLSNYTVFYQNVRGYHWNVRGEKFFELHLKFEELYNNLFLKIDEIAERILTLGYAPNHRASEYLKTATIKETKEVNDGFKAVDNILNSFQDLLVRQRVILELSAEISDEGTNSLMSDYIREQEKLVWMYSAFLNK
ncbi:MAG: Dps family protein [Flavobacteriaceae bacterium]